MNTCVVCCYDEQTKCEGLECKCQVCVVCFVIYIKSHIEQISFSLDKPCRCVGGCDNLYSIDDILEIAKQNNVHSGVDETLLSHYLQRTEDIRGCPAQKCSYYGVLPSKKCGYSLICNQCGGQWNCFELMTLSSKILSLLKNVNRSKEFLTYTYEFAFTNNCPQCRVPIYKNGGCLHMTCVRCSHEFCWICKQNYHTHQGGSCLSHILTYYGVILNFFFNFLVYYQYHLTIVNFLFFIVSFILNFSLHNSILALIGLGGKFAFDVQHFWRCLRRSPNGNIYYEKQRTQGAILLLTMCTLLGATLAFMSYYTDITIYSWCDYMFWEAILAFLGGGCAFLTYHASITFVDRWANYVR